MDIAMETQLCKRFCECRLPQAVGAIDRTHVEISTLEDKTSVDDCCLKYKYAINIYNVIGLNLIFMDVDTGFHGSVDTGFYFSLHGSRARTTIIESRRCNWQPTSTAYFFWRRCTSSTSWVTEPYAFDLQLIDRQKWFLAMPFP